MPRLILLRHAESIGNTMTQDERAAHVLPNHAFPLTERGIAQARLTAAYLQDHNLLSGLVKVQHSSFARAAQTAEIIAAHCGVTCTEETALNEKWDGIFHEFSTAEVKERYPDQIKARDRSDYYHFRPLGGESCVDVEHGRVALALLAMFTLRHDTTVLWVGHGRWFAILEKALHAQPVAEFLASYKQNNMPNGSLTIYHKFPEDLTCERIVPWQGILPETETSYA